MAQEKASTATRELHFFVNERAYTVAGADVPSTLAAFLRESASLKGTKIGCNEGGCGACTVMVSRYDRVAKSVRHTAVNSCLTPLCSVDGCHVVTVEGIGNSRKGLHPVQQRIAELYGSQCGFCTPGIVMSLYASLQNRPNQTKKEIEELFDGNLCRCTGYRPILDAAKTFACDSAIDIEDLCNSKDVASGACSTEAKEKCNGATGAHECSTRAHVVSSTTSKTQKYPKLDKMPGVPFPESLKSYVPKSVSLASEYVQWRRPVDLQELLAIKRDNPDAKLVFGNTEVGIETRFKHCDYNVQVAMHEVHELQQIHQTESHIVIGSLVTIARLQEFCSEFASKALQDEPEDASCCVTPVLQMARWFAGTQIRNVASIGGNICTASPISDLNPVWQSLGAVFEIAHLDGTNEVHTRNVSARDFFIKYRVTELKPNEVLQSISVPIGGNLDFYQCYKQARRREDDIAICDGAFRMRLEPKQGSEQTFIIADCGISFGGMAPISKTATETENFLRGQVWSHELFEKAYDVVRKDVHITEDTPGGQAEYRNSLAVSYLFKFFVYVSNQLVKKNLAEASLVDAQDSSAAQMFERPVTSGIQEYEEDTATELHASKAHHASQCQVTGEAAYTDDLPEPHGCLHAALVYTDRPIGTLKAIDVSKAKASAGVEGIFDAKHLKESGGTNAVGEIIADEEAFVTHRVWHVGQIVAMVVADTVEHARRAARLVKVEYEDSDEKPILSIDDALARIKAIEQKQDTSPDASGEIPLLPTEHRIDDGDVDAAMANVERKISGEMRVGGQEHFYLEPNVSLAIPGDLDELVVWLSSQSPRAAQEAISHALGMPAHRVTCKVKRLGGAFGGKETRFIHTAVMSAFAARQLNKPVKICLERDEDMATTGQRHPFLGQYTVGVTNDGHITAFDLKLFSNGGYSHDLSIPVLDRALFHATNCYKIPNVRAIGRVCRTNLPSNTAFRGFGGPQAMMIFESVMDHVARELSIAPAVLRERHLYRKDDVTHFGQSMENCPLPQLWSQLGESADFAERSIQVAKFNAENRWRKRGISMIPTQFGISFTALHLNQAGALVHVYTDGSVLVSHGGTEMGQGLHTKMIQVAANALGVPTSRVHISETSTDKVPNTSATAASASSDLNGMAVLKACEQINSNLAPVRAKHPDLGWNELVSKAYFERVGLWAHGFYRTPNIGFDFDVGKGRAFNYFVFGVACAEVEVDTLTGDHHILRSDLLLDIGRSLNPSIDIGQIEGAFTQGMGLFTQEELIWGDSEHKWVRPGHLFTRGPGAYKIPSFNDVPIDFRVSLLKNAPNKYAIHSSKAVGEPPLFLAASVFYAIKEAIYASRQTSSTGSDTAKSGFIALQSPATSERIRMACSDKFTKKYVDDESKNAYQPKLSC